MSTARSRKIELLLEAGAWAEVRPLVERELSDHPENHWLLTQLGVTFYEEGRYREALHPFLTALEIVPDCPLTLWNLAGTLDALGKPEVAVPVYAWLLGSKTSPDEDPCWESKEWADSLKTDCVFRVGLCFQRLGQRESAELCLRQYINLLLAGMQGTYPLEDAARHIRELNGKGQKKLDKEVRNAIDSTLRDSAIRAIQGRRRKLPKLSLAELLAT